MMVFSLELHIKLNANISIYITRFRLANSLWTVDFVCNKIRLLRKTGVILIPGCVLQFECRLTNLLPGPVNPNLIDSHCRSRIQCSSPRIPNASPRVRGHTSCPFRDVAQLLISVSLPSPFCQVDGMIKVSEFHNNKHFHDSLF